MTQQEFKNRISDILNAESPVHEMLKDQNHDIKTLWYTVYKDKPLRQALLNMIKNA